MVSTGCSILLALAVAFSAADQSANPAPAPSGFANTTTRSEVATVKPPPPQEVTPEVRGDIYMARKMYREAIDVYRQIPLYEKSAVLMNKIGIAYHQTLDFETAKKHYEKAIKLNRKYSEAINNLGTIWYAKRNYGKAVKQYEKALKLNPYSASIYSNLGTAQFARKKYNQAMEAYQIALSLDPDVFEHRGTHGVLLQERSVEERAKFHYTIAKLYAMHGIFDRALMYMRKCLEEGFKDRDKFKEEPAFAKMRELPEFQELLALEPRVL
ncbi:MAG: tetratricopeptide repeat protein [Acidobacteria bacterium]|nr:tetratricopeptide repeat protein [Acidobacteriota bacterium]